MKLVSKRKHYFEARSRNEWRSQAPGGGGQFQGLFPRTSRYWSHVMSGLGPPAPTAPKIQCPYWVSTSPISEKKEYTSIVESPLRCTFVVFRLARGKETETETKAERNGAGWRRTQKKVRGRQGEENVCCSSFDA